MPRRKRQRMIAHLPPADYFKPRGIMLRDLEQVVLAHEEVEALRLRDVEGLHQTKAAKRMKISRPTFQRVLVSARQKVSEALVFGKAIRVEGGEWKMANQNVPGRGLGRGRNRPAGRTFAPPSGGRGRMGGPLAAGPGGKCVCPKCGYSETHPTGVPCMDKVCPKCGAKLTREA